MADDRKKNELDIFKQWKKTGEVKHFQSLYNSMKPLVYKAAEKAAYGSNLPESAHRAFAAQAFYDALRTFSPTSGAALQTHVYGSVQNKVKRLNYMYSNLGHIPEPRMQQVGQYNAELETLRAELNRDPTPQEIAQRLKWSVTDVQRLQSELRRDLSISGDTEEQAFFEGSRDEEILEHLFFELTPEERTLYEYIFGKNGKPRMLKASGKIDFDNIAKRMGSSTSKIRAIFGQIRNKLGKALKR